LRGEPGSPDFVALRLSDLIRLAWSHVGEDAITLRTGKSRQKREAMIPLYDDLRAVLARIPKRSTTILTSTRLKPWTASGLSTAVQRAKADAKWEERDLPSMICAAPLPPSSTSAASACELSPKSWHGRRKRSTRSSVATSAGRRRRRRSSLSLTRPEGEHSLQNRLQNQSTKIG
jgi:hypothetical protein